MNQSDKDKRDDLAENYAAGSGHIDQAFCDGFDAGVKHEQERSVKLEAEVKRLRDALDFYASEENWVRRPYETWGGDIKFHSVIRHEDIDEVGGKRAREALK